MAIYLVSDLHGMYDLYRKICDFIKPEDKVICLGDCGDRGPASWATIKAVYENPQWEYFMGNHEHMLIEAMAEYLTGELSSIYSPTALDLLVYNGGYQTYNGWLEERDLKLWYKRLSNLPRSGTYEREDGKTILFNHAGCTPEREADYLWDRRHIEDEWPKGFKDTYIIHGHTPVSYIRQIYCKMSHKRRGAMWYANDHKCCIDMGSVDTEYTILLDIDTFEEHIIMLENI